jgi:hypothetical protein
MDSSLISSFVNTAVVVVVSELPRSMFDPINILFHPSVRRLHGGAAVVRPYKT